MNIRKAPMKNHLWNNKPYHSLDYHLQEKFGEKIYKISLNARMTCPNRDHSIGSRGCIFCSQGGSGDFAGSPSIYQQIEEGKKYFLDSPKNTGKKFIAYFQAFTNTYAPVSYLREVYMEALSHPDIVALSIATRPDCLEKEKLDLLEEIQSKKPVFIELGLQTIHEETACFIRRGYSLPCFEETLRACRSRKIPIVVHTIFGLPFETEKMMMETISYLAQKDIQGIKLQLLQVLKTTDLALIYKEKPFKTLTLEEYVDYVVRAIEILPETVVIHRLTGDPPKDLLIAPLWCLKKRVVLNTIHKEFQRRNTWQGKKYKRLTS